MRKFRELGGQNYFASTEVRSREYSSSGPLHRRLLRTKSLVIQTELVSCCCLLAIYNLFAKTLLDCKSSRMTCSLGRPTSTKPSELLSTLNAPLSSDPLSNFPQPCSRGAVVSGPVHAMRLPGFTGARRSSPICRVASISPVGLHFRTKYARLQNQNLVLPITLVYAYL